MHNNQKPTVNIEVSENQHDGYSLLISDGSTGYNLSGGKVGGCDSVCDFDINANELIQKVEEFANITPTRSELLQKVAELEARLAEKENDLNQYTECFEDETARADRLHAILCNVKGIQN
ncbi:hypothetical protein HWB57_gp032 [Erwinia phage vB_EamM-Bue1]|uniref:Uncharacterized protein n=1 Tax=Erwinia phage vB_EamM-Bue1 TaxID=2099338 RepID=A0A2P1JU43_9CAUD|nr:hypothetical protein HWB57_gp032 [Erwinia phage vB_EamM-Bue1]AVO22875.1 hypothetical protein [Erwinia phage vB_EamM-Bue1]